MTKCHTVLLFYRVTLPEREFVIVHDTVKVVSVNNTHHGLRPLVKLYIFLLLKNICLLNIFLRYR